MADSKIKKLGDNLGGALSMLGALLTPMLRSRRQRWGATADEVQRSLPGDELVPTPRWAWTHAITIHAPADEVWRWLVQVGQGRGGFYSYEMLENLVGCQIRNADRIVPELQQLQVGDTIKLHPQMPGFPVAVLEPEQTLVLHSMVDLQSGQPADDGGTPQGNVANMLWMWHLEEAGQGATRLITRTRYDYQPTFGNKLMYGPTFIEPIGHVMDVRMLQGIKERAEASAARREK